MWKIKLWILEERRSFLPIFFLFSNTHLQWRWEDWTPYFLNGKTILFFPLSQVKVVNQKVWSLINGPSLAGSSAFPIGKKSTCYIFGFQLKVGWWICCQLFQSHCLCETKSPCYILGFWLTVGLYQVIGFSECTFFVGLVFFLHS